MRSRIAGRRGLVSAVALAVAAVGIASPSRVHAQAAVKLDDPTIVAIFDAANTWDIETGRLGVKKATTKDIRDYGAMLVRDHTTVRQQERDLAKKLLVTPTPPKGFALAKAHTAAMKKLGELKGAAFDKAFLENEVEYHQAVIDAINNSLLPSLQNAEVKDLVTKIAPAFAAHRDAAKNLLAKLK